MKRVFLTIALGAVVLAAAAEEQPNHVGITFGYNLSGMSASGSMYTSNSEGVPNPDWKMMSGFQIGIASEFQLKGAWFLQPSISFATHGVRDSYMQTGGKKEAERSFRFYYLQLPVNVEYKIKWDLVNVVLQAGPYVEYGLFGRQKYTVDGSSKDLNDTYKKLKFVDEGEKNHIGPAFQYGIGVGAGIQIVRFQILLGYRRGLSTFNFSKDAYQRNYRYKMHSNELSLTINWFFGHYEPLIPEE